MQPKYQLIETGYIVWWFSSSTDNQTLPVGITANLDCHSQYKITQLSDIPYNMPDDITIGSIYELKMYWV